MTKLFKLFRNSKYFSTKFKNYFPIYEILFNKYVNKNLVFVEIGVLDGGSLFMWKKYFGNKARIIGIDLNPNAKKIAKNNKIEIFIGNQADPDFWKSFFKKVGKIDILLDDGGHTNKQQILTSTNVKHIRDGGMIVVEDTHTSYQEAFGNPSKFSFINFAKKTIDDINFRFPSLGSFNYSLNKYIHSVQFFESIVCINVNKALCKKNLQIKNNGIKIGNTDFRYKNKKRNKKFIDFIFSYKILRKIYIILKDNFKIGRSGIKNYFN